MYFFTKHFVMKNYIFFVVVKVFSKQFCDYAVNQVLLKSNFKFITKKHTYLSVHRHSISAREETESARNRFGRPIQSVRTCKQVFIPLSAYCQTNNSNSVVCKRRVVERETKTQENNYFRRPFMQFIDPEKRLLHPRDRRLLKLFVILGYTKDSCVPL